MAWTDAARKAAAEARKAHERAKIRYKKPAFKKAVTRSTNPEYRLGLAKEIKDSRKGLIKSVHSSLDITMLRAIASSAGKRAKAKRK